MGFAHKKRKSLVRSPLRTRLFHFWPRILSPTTKLKNFIFRMLLENAKTFDLFKKAALWKNQTPSRVLQTTSVLVFSNGRAKDI